MTHSRIVLALLLATSAIAPACNPPSMPTDASTDATPVDTSIDTAASDAIDAPATDVTDGATNDATNDTTSVDAVADTSSADTSDVRMSSDASGVFLCTMDLDPSRSRNVGMATAGCLGRILQPGSGLPMFWGIDCSPNDATGSSYTCNCFDGTNTVSGSDFAAPGGACLTQEGLNTLFKTHCQCM